AFTAKERGTYAMKAYKISFNIPDSLKPQYYIDIADMFSDINDHENYKDFNFKALRIAEKVGDKGVIANAYFSLGLYYVEKNYKSDSAYYYFNRAEHAYADIKDTLKLGNSIMNMGIVQRYENDFLGSQ